MEIIKALNVREIEEVYTKMAINDFDKTELKPLKTILRQFSKDLYKCYGMYVDNRITAYAFFAKSTGSNYMLLDYFAVQKDYRRQNIGSRFFDLLKKTIKNCDYILAEVENPNYHIDKEDKTIKENREKFYIKNNFTKTFIECEVFKHKYTLFCLSLDNVHLDEKEIIITNFLNVYKEMLKSETYENNIKIINP